MKKLLLIVIAVGALNTVPALAADMPIKAPPTVEPHFSWTGFYFGADIGGG
jgi:hypothetical protein